MKKYGAISLILGVIFYLSYILFAQDNRTDIFNGQRDMHDPNDQINQNGPVDRTNDTAEPGNQKTTEPQKMDFNGNEGGKEDIDDESYFADDQDIFSRKLFQKKLPPLSHKEKIIWAFRLSKTTIFL